MKEYITGAWAGLSQTGRTVVLITLFVVVGVLISLAMYYKLDLSWIPGVLT